MLNKKVIIGLIIALIAIVVIGFAALNFVPNNNLINLNPADNATDAPVVVSQNQTDDAEVNVTVDNATDVIDSNATADANSTDTNDTNDTKDNSSDVNAGDVLHKQSLVISGNSSDQYQGIESGTYIVYYTGNDGIIKIEKVI